MKHPLLILFVLLTFVDFGQKSDIELSIDLFSNPWSVNQPIFIKAKTCFDKEEKRLDNYFSLEYYEIIGVQHNLSIQYGKRFEIINKKVNFNYSLGTGPFLFFWMDGNFKQYNSGVALSNSLDFGKQLNHFGFFLGGNLTSGYGYSFGNANISNANRMKFTVYGQPYLKISYRF